MKLFFQILLVSLPLLTVSEAKGEGFWGWLEAPEEQGRLRSENSVGVGMPLTEPYNLPSHFQYRFGERVLVGTSYSIEKVGYDDALSSRLGEYRYETNTQTGSAYIEYYVSGKSGFHIGLGGEWRSGTFAEYTLDSSHIEQRTAEGAYQGIYGGPSFGWTWIWSNGITFGFDISRRKRFQSSFKSDDLSVLSATEKENRLGKEVMPESAPGMLMLGYSF